MFRLKRLVLVMHSLIPNHILARALPFNTTSIFNIIGLRLAESLEREEPIHCFLALTITAVCDFAA